MKTLRFSHQYDFLFKIENIAPATTVTPRLDQFDLFADDYKVGADRLVKLYMKNPMHNQSLVQSIVHLYRQYLEWKLKESIRRLNYLTWKGDEFPGHHRLNLLWKDCAVLIEAAQLDLDSDDLQKIEQIIEEFHTMDIVAVTTAYADQSQGNEMRVEVDVYHMAQALKGVSQFFDFVITLVLLKAEEETTGTKPRIL